MAGWRAATVYGQAPGAGGAGPVPVRPLGTLDLVDEPFGLLRANFRTLLLLAGSVLVPLEFVSAWLQRDVVGGLGLRQFVEDPFAAQVALETANSGLLQTMLVQGIASVTLLAALEGLLARVAVSSTLGERLGPAEALRATLRQWPTLMLVALLTLAASFGTGLLGLLLIALGGFAGAAAGALVMLAAIPIGVAAYVLLIAAPAVVVVEAAGPLEALRRSVALVRRRFWPVLGAITLVTLVAAVVQFSLSAVPSVVAFAASVPQPWLLSAVGSIAAAVVVTPYAALVAALVYVDGRVRTEALDLEILADSAMEDVPAAAG